MVIRELLNTWERRESAMILSHYLMKSRAWIYAHPDEEVGRKVEELVRRAVSMRQTGYPLQYILGNWDFYTIELKVQEGVLIPRKETELLVDTALSVARQKHWDTPSVIDIGTGSGAIALAVQKHLPKARVTATDISRAALETARENARNLGLERVRFLEGDLFAGTDTERFDLILSNPPYLRDDEELQKEVTFEPPMALFAGPRGLDVYRRLIPLAFDRLTPGGVLLLEIGAEQAADILELLTRAGFSACRVEKDLAGFDRMVAAEKEDAHGHTLGTV